MQEKIQAAAALRAEVLKKRASVEETHMRRLEAVRDSNRRKTMKDAIAWLRQAARNPHEANMHRSVLHAPYVLKSSSSLVLRMVWCCRFCDRTCSVAFI